MKCQILFSGKNKENITYLSPAELAQRVVKINSARAQNSKFTCSVRSGPRSTSVTTLVFQLFGRPLLRICIYSSNLDITKTYLYNVDPPSPPPLKPHFYIVKPGFTGVYIIFRISAQKHRLWVLVRNCLAEAVLTSTHNLCFEQKYEKYQNFYLKILIYSHFW